MKKDKTVLALGLVFSIIALMSTGCTSSSSVKKGNSTISNNQQSTGKDSDGDGIPDAAEKLLGTNPYTADTNGNGVPDKLDKNPIYTPNPIKETATALLPVKIKDIRVQDNVNATDHLEITLTNTGKTDLKNIDCYFNVVDTVTKAKEGYYVKLIMFTLEAGTTKALHFDNKNGDLIEVKKPISQTQIDKISQDNKNMDLHYNGNMNGIYGTSKNEATFIGQIHAKNYAPLKFSAIKAKGTAEVAD